MTAQSGRAVFRGVDWAFYKNVLETVGENGGLCVAFDGKDLEIMAPGPLHEHTKVRARQLVDLVAEELDIDVLNLASTTWGRPEIARAIEADECYYFRSGKVAQAIAALARNIQDISSYPMPDLAIEIDISPSQIDRQGIYAALGVTEIWRFRASGLVIERLDDSGSYTPALSSAFLPVTSEEVSRWVLQESKSDPTTWKRRLREWIRAELLPRPRPTQP
jgi:Uma2 family endonuclease